MHRLFQSEKAFDVKIDTPMKMQSNYDIAETRRREKDIKGVRRFHAAMHP